LYSAAAIKEAAELAKEAEEADKVAADWYAAEIAQKKKQSKKICSDCTHCRWGVDLPAGGFDLEEYLSYKAAANEKADELDNKYKESNNLIIMNQIDCNCMEAEKNRVSINMHRRGIIEEISDALAEAKEKREAEAKATTADEDNGMPLLKKEKVMVQRAAPAAKAGGRTEASFVPALAAAEKSEKEDALKTAAEGNASAPLLLSPSTPPLPCLPPSSPLPPLTPPLYPTYLTSPPPPLRPSPEEAAAEIATVEEALSKSSELVKKQNGMNADCYVNSVPIHPLNPPASLPGGVQSLRCHERGHEPLGSVSLPSPRDSSSISVTARPNDDAVLGISNIIGGAMSSNSGCLSLRTLNASCGSSEQITPFQSPNNVRSGKPLDELIAMYGCEELLEAGEKSVEKLIAEYDVVEHLIAKYNVEKEKLPKADEESVGDLNARHSPRPKAYAEAVDESDDFLETILNLAKPGAAEAQGRRPLSEEVVVDLVASYSPSSTATGEHAHLVLAKLLAKLRLTEYDTSPSCCKMGDTSRFLV
jgi:hypothetical protein